MSAEIKLSDDQFWALERWVMAVSRAAWRTPPGFHDPAQIRHIRDTAYVALTGRTPASKSVLTPSATEDPDSRQRHAREQIKEIRSS